MAAEEQQHRGRRHRDEIDGGEEHSERRVRGELRIEEFGAHFGEVCFAPRFTTEQLGHQYARYLFVQVGVDTRQTLAHFAVCRPHDFLKDNRRDNHHGEHDERHQRQLPTQNQHRGNDKHQPDQVTQQRNSPLCDELVQRVDIVGDARQQTTDRVAIKEAEAHALDMAEDDHPNVDDDFLAHHLHHVVLGIAKAKGCHECAEVHHENRDDSINVLCGDWSIDGGP